MAPPQKGQGLPEAWEGGEDDGISASPGAPTAGTDVGMALLAAAAVLDSGLPQSMQNSAPGSLARPQKAQVVTGGAFPLEPRSYDTPIYCAN